MATQADYDAGTAALAKIVAAAIKANVPALEQSMIPQALISAIEAQGAKAVIDSYEANHPTEGTQS